MMETKLPAISACALSWPQLLFSRKGFHEARVEEIAEEAEVGKGTVYECFTVPVRALFGDDLLYP